MYCPNCGKDVTDAGKFCKWCGASLKNDRQNTQYDFDDALYESFASEGLSLLSTPKRLVALTTDIGAQNTAEFRVFEYNCDREFLEPFSKVASSVADEKSLDDAANRATLVLRDRAIDSAVAEKTAWGVRNAVARSMSLPASTPPEPIAKSPDRTSVKSVERTKTVASARLAPTNGMPPKTMREAPKDADPIPYSTTRNSQLPPDPVVYGQSASTNAPQQSSHVGLVAVLVLLIVAVGVVSCFLMFVDVGQGPISSVNTETLPTDSAFQVVVDEGESDTMVSFPRGWTGSYDGWSLDQNGENKKIRRQVSFNFTDITEKGSLKGVCYIGADDVTSGATSATYNIAGTVDWKTGDIHVHGTSWIDKGGLAQLRQYNGTVDFSAQTMSGKASDADSGEYEGAWHMKATDVINVNVPAPVSSSQAATSASADANSGSSDSIGAQQDEQSPPSNSSSGASSNRAEDFPRSWRGTYDGYDGKDQKISRSVSFEFSSVLENGDLEGTCSVGKDEEGVGATNARYKITGHIDWESGEIYVAGTEWLEQGGLKDLRQYEGVVDFGAKRMSGIASDVGTHDYEGGWSMSAS